MSTDTINKDDFDYEVVMLTTSPKVDKPTHVTIRSAREVSTAICDQIQTVSSEQIGSFVGSCSKKEMDSIDAALEISLALTPTMTSGTVWTDDDDDEEPETTVTTTEGSTEDFLWEENQRLEKELAKAQHGEEILRQMYNELLLQTLKIDNTEKVR